MGFTARYKTYPGLDEITSIEGVTILDFLPPAVIRGIGVGTVACVGEFADMTYAVKVDSSGNVTTNPRPIEIFGATDQINFLGGFDSTLGEHGKSCGNGYLAIQHPWSRLVCVPVNFASSKACRAWRTLPTNKSATDPTPIVPVASATVIAGREFKAGANRVRVAGQQTFAGTAAYLYGTDGSVTAAMMAGTTQTFTSASGNFIVNGVKVGDILVVGSLNAAAMSVNLANALQLRVTAVAGATSLTVETMDGGSFNWTTGASLVWRIHKAAVADTGGNNAMATTAGYTIPVRALDATVTDTVLDPTIVPPSATGTNWDPLSGLKLRTQTGMGNGVVYTAAIQAVNAPYDATMYPLYTAAIDALLADDLPEREVNIVFSARKSATIRTYLKQHVLTASSQGFGRLACNSPALDCQTLAGATGDTDSGSGATQGVGANRDERVLFAWPGVQLLYKECVNISMARADGSSTSDGTIDVTCDELLASVLSVLLPERNPGEVTDTTKKVLGSIKALQLGAPVLTRDSYKQLKANGVVAPRIDKEDGPQFQSGVTSSLTPGEETIERRRFADYLQDSLAKALQKFAKLPMTQVWKDTQVAEVNTFLSNLVSEGDPTKQRMAGFTIDEEKGNTDAALALGVFCMIIDAKSIPTGKSIVLQTTVGPNVVLVKQL